MAEPTEHYNESVRLLDHVVLDDRMNPWLENQTFTDCELVGPAVLMLVESDNVFDHVETRRGMFWEIDPDRPHIGAIGLRNCTLRRCTFRGVGLAADRATIRRFGA